MSGPVNPRVTQADRDAGAEFWAFLGQHGSAEQCRNGTGFRATAEAFARHREAAEAEAKAREAAMVEALELLRSFGCPYCNGDCGSANPPVTACPMTIASKAIALTKEPDA